MTLIVQRPLFVAFLWTRVTKIHLKLVLEKTKAEERIAASVSTPSSPQAVCKITFVHYIENFKGTS